MAVLSSLIRPQLKLLIQQNVGKRRRSPSQADSGRERHTDTVQDTRLEDFSGIFIH